VRRLSCGIWPQTSLGSNAVSSRRLHQAIVPWARFYLTNVAEWESAQLYEAALTSKEYRKLAERFKDVARYHPGLYEVVKT
jgi:heme oxygenase (mycobilin-producing)